MPRLYLLLVGLWFAPLQPLYSQEPLVPGKQPKSLRIATYNISLNRPQAGKLARDLQSDDAQIAAVASVIRTVQPDILLINEIDFEERTEGERDRDNASLFAERFLANAQPDGLGNAAWPMPHRFSAPVNTGVPSGLDLNRNGKLGEPEDAWGYGAFPGQYGMAILSRFEFDPSQVRTFQNMLWSQLPNPLQPINQDGQPYYPAEIWSQLRISSKSFWDLPIVTPYGTLHVLASHPTPPAFDGPEDRNGCRNHDEIKLIQHYIEGSPLLVNDRGEVGGLTQGDSFVILGDLNCDPLDGDSRRQAIVDLLDHPQVSSFPPPRSRGAVLASEQQAGANLKHKSDPANDTSDFNDRTVGNLRVDYALPSADFNVLASGVFWPVLDDAPTELRATLKSALDASDHHLVWIDIQLK